MTPRRSSDWHRQLTYCVGLLCACRHVALGILVRLDQQLDEAGNDRCFLQWGMVGWAQGQIPDQADGCLARKRTTIRGISWVSGGSQFPSIISSSPIIISLYPRLDQDMLADPQRMRSLQPMSLVPQDL